MKRGVAVLALGAGIIASPAAARCPRPCRSAITRTARECARACPTEDTRTACTTACAGQRSADLAACRAATHPAPPSCGQTTTTTSATITTTTLPGGSCTANADCDDGNPCTADQCVDGHCEHGCVCVDSGGGSCCGPGPACVQACGDTFPACDGACPAGSSCTSLTGAPACQCVPGGCSPGDGKYFYTCGDPVCGGDRGHPGVSPCTTEQAGIPCSCLGAECDPGDECNRLLECATSDPTHGGMCPISRRRYKQDIRYLTADEVKRLHGDVLDLRLALFRYNLPGAPSASRLGFIIDDVGPSPAVAPNGETVDLYGYTSMAVAALQEQAREIDRLKREMRLLRRQLRKRGR